MALLLIVIAAVVLTSAAQNESSTLWSGDVFPNPQVDFERCGMLAPSYLCDPDKILDQDARIAVQQTADKEQKAIQQHGVKLMPGVQACVGVRGLHIYTAMAKRIQTMQENKTADADMLRFTNLLALNWKLETRPCQNFVIIIGVENEKLMYIKKGQHLILPTGTATHHVFQTHSTHFNENHYQQGFENMISSFSKLLTETTTTSTTTTSTTTTSTTTTTTTTPSTTTTTTPATTTTTTPTTPTVVTTKDTVTGNETNNQNETMVKRAQLESLGTYKRGEFPWWLIVLAVCLIAILISLICFFLVFIVKRKQIQPTDKGLPPQIAGYDMEKGTNGIPPTVLEVTGTTGYSLERPTRLPSPTALSETEKSARLSIDSAHGASLAPSSPPASIGRQISEDQVVSCQFPAEAQNAETGRMPSRLARPANLPQKDYPKLPDDGNNSRPESYHEAESQPRATTPTRFAKRMQHSRSEEEGAAAGFPPPPPPLTPTKTADVHRLSQFQH